MNNLKKITSVAVLVALLAVGGVVFSPQHSVYAQQQGAQTLGTTTLSSALTTTYGTSVNLASIANITATAAVQTTLWVDTEAMDVVTNGVPASGTTVQVTRGAHGTKAETHASGRTVYVGRPNLFQNYDQAGSCTTGTGYAAIQPWINISNGKRQQCLSGGEWFTAGSGSATSAAVTAATGFCTGTLGSAETDFLNGAACSGATTSTYRYLVTTPGEIANLRVFSSANETAAAGDTLTVNKNGSATTLTCKIVQNAATCNDVTHSAAVAAGDVLTFSIVAATSAAGANISASVGIYNQ